MSAREKRHGSEGRGSLCLPLKIRGHALRLSHEQPIENQKLPLRGRLLAKLMTQLRKGFGQRIKAVGTEQVLGKLEFLSMSTL